ncbi:RNA-dependent ATPase [Mortierella hygrophila]|uniref:RNA helicase n=1 Tax=Mortierella hygrophila TaxID=979708 RepID=A0A9P6FAY0_9FUNG|nr:RNA-dependent ATPase [Mortierella hygrophila]
MSVTNDKKSKKDKKEKVAAAAASSDVEDASAVTKKEKKNKKERKDKKDKKDKKEKKEKKEKRKADDNNNSDDDSNTTATTEDAPVIKKLKVIEVAQPLKATVVSGTTPTTGGLVKSFYNVSTNKTTKEQAREFYKENTIEVSGDQDFLPVLKFDEAGFRSEMIDVTKSFKAPSPIQAACWPIVLSGRDIIGIAETGSGKTLAFTLPALMHIKGQKDFNVKPKGPTVLVVSPTRELAMQTMEQCVAAGKSSGIKSVCIYGGVSKDDQRKAIRQGVHIIVATPGRLLDLMEDGSCNIDNVSYMVLDEADRMLDTGFEEAIRSILRKTRKDRQTCMFSATWPESVRKLAHDFLDRPIKVTIGSPDLGASSNVTQIVEVMDDPRNKERRLLDLLKDYHKTRKNRILIFALYKKEADRIEQTLLRAGYKVGGIHGDKTQNTRTAALEAFKNGSIPLLVATDVAARGIDITGITHVINVTFPLTIEDYVHRIGRTARGGQTGIAHTFFTVNEKGLSGALINVLNDAGVKIPDELRKFGGTVKKKAHSIYGDHFKDMGDQPMKAATKIRFE